MARRFRAAAVALITASALTLTACNEKNGIDTEDGTITERTVTTSDGREITCLAYSVTKAGGLSCDW